MAKDKAATVETVSKIAKENGENSAVKTVLENQNALVSALSVKGEGQAKIVSAMNDAQLATLKVVKDTQDYSEQRADQRIIEITELLEEDNKLSIENAKLKSDLDSKLKIQQLENEIANLKEKQGRIIIEEGSGKVETIRTPIDHTPWGETIYGNKKVEAPTKIVKVVGLDEAQEILRKEVRKEFEKELKTKTEEVQSLNKEVSELNSQLAEAEADKKSEVFALESKQKRRIEELDQKYKNDTAAYRRIRERDVAFWKQSYHEKEMKLREELQDLKNKVNSFSSNWALKLFGLNKSFN